MILSSVPPGAAVFVDANIFIYHFTNEPTFGPACSQLIERAEMHDIQGFTSTHVLADVAHRLMTLEAMQLFCWPYAGVAARLRKHPDAIPKLSIYRQAIASIPVLGVHVIPVTFPVVEAATLLSQQHRLLTGDALIVAAMRANGLTDIASNDADFDRVPGIARFAPV